MMDGWLDGAQSELGGSPPMTKKEPKGQMIQRDSSSLLTFDAASAFASGRLDQRTVEAVYYNTITDIADKMSKFNIVHAQTAQRKL